MTRTFDPAAWYRPADPAGPVLQGDQFFDVALRKVVPNPNHPGQYAIGLFTADVIVATQSCDLLQHKVAEIEVIPVYAVVEWLSYQPSFFNQLETIRRGHVPSLYLLPAWPQAPFVSAQLTRVVTFDEKRSITWDDLSACQQAPWLGLQSPYIEHFGQALARFYMRVGLPEDMPALAWTAADRDRASRNEQITLTHEQVVSASLPPPARSLVVSIQKFQLANNPDVLFKATLKQDGTYFGIGRSPDEAIVSLLNYLAAKRTELIEKPRAEGESPHWLLTLFPYSK